MIYRICFSFIFFLSVLNTHGQENLSPEEDLKKRFLNYCATVPWEEIYIHSDRSEYIAGEDLWFALYLFDRQEGKLSDHSSLAYFDLINSDNRRLIAKRIALDKGIGQGHIILPDTLSTGRYIIRAHTNWMRNFLPENCFVKEITVYNPLSDRTLKSVPQIYGTTIGKADSIKPLYKTRTGIEMNITKKGDGKTEVKLITDEGFRTANTDRCYLLVQTHGVVDLVRKIDLKSASVNVSLIDEVLKPGVNHLVIFNTELEPVYEKFIYTPLKESAYPKLSSADTFRTRERVNLNISFEKGESESGSDHSFSISAGPVTDSVDMPVVADYMVFGTEFGTLPQVFRSNRLKDIPADTIDRFLMHAQSNWINWKSVISGEPPALSHPAEKDYHFITGRLTEKATRLPLKGKNVFLSVPGKTATFQYSLTDSTGLFSFILPVNNEIWDIIIQPEDTEIKSAIILESSFAEEFLQNRGHSDTASLTVPEFISKWGVNYQVSKIYGINTFTDTSNQFLRANPSKRFYGKPDIELTMSDYIRLPLMEEVFFELTPGVQLKRKRDTFIMTVADPVSNRIYEKPPVLLVDGVVINNPAVLAAIDPETVEKIDVIKDLYLVGDYIFFGIVNVITTAGDFSGTPLPDNSIRMKYRVVDPVVSFSSPDYSSDLSKKSRIPDFRNTLYWNPFVKSSGNNKSTVEFWTSDDVGSYEVTLQGVNSEGEPVSARKVITVR